MFLTLIAATALVPQAPLALSCPSTGEDIGGEPAETIYYNGARYGTCCSGCANPFLKNPAKSLKSDAVKGKTLGVFLFDPVSGKRLEAKKAGAGPSLYNGLAYYFESAANKTKFDAEPKKFGTAPEKELLYCPVMGHGVSDHAAAGGFADHGGVRYYVCCGGCLGPLQTDAAKYVGKVASKAKAPVAALKKA